METTSDDTQVTSLQQRILYLENFFQVLLLQHGRAEKRAERAADRGDDMAFMYELEMNHLESLMNATKETLRVRLKELFERLGQLICQSLDATLKKCECSKNKGEPTTVNSSDLASIWRPIFQTYLH
ncbi:hypothetical protein CAPTEDRAFT_190324 [Capitella teleta]|uniref:Uncharacterized protein n=1 Tax=Capitella teleta TaxID=283909 RepID=R7V4H5_CAPTE|nr:hypothetical protein CAPTEDRAFT_190324 [Capitella teleta]|eukprot:ELU13738.1 hypothetical protein CAPTEDRAFT_190324 [Capitella teleta]